nr:DUF1127 domain-containing protein [Roseisalinus antarcticus]
MNTSAATTRPVRSGLRNTGLVARLLDLVGLYTQRRALARLDDAALRDIGLSRRDAMTEANRPLWDLPRTGR